MSDTLDIPRDVSMNVPNIRMVGNMEITIENHKGIIEYSKNLIRINSYNGIIKICGKELEIREINQEFITIFGILEVIEFIK